jgi:hypothetical protein
MDTEIKADVSGARVSTLPDARGESETIDEKRKRLLERQLGKQAGPLGRSG